MFLMGLERGKAKVQLAAALLISFLSLAGCKGPWSKEFQPDEGKPGNKAPAVSPVPLTNLSNSGSGQIPFTISAENGPVDCRSAVSTRSSDISVVPATYMNVTGTAPNCLLTVTPAPGAVGMTTITLTAGAGETFTSTNFTVNVYGPPALAGTPVRTAIRGQPYAGFSVSGGGGLPPYSYSITSGALPSGMSLNASSGAVSGTPTDDGHFTNIVIRVSDAGGGTGTLAPFDIYVACCNLDFTAVPTLDPFVSFSRTSAGARVKSTGDIEFLGFNQPRFDYASSGAGVLRGLLVEEPRSNLLTLSEEFDSSYWTTSSSTIAANSVAGPDGRVTAEKLTENNGNSQHRLRGGALTVAANQPYTFSVFVKTSGRTAVTLLLGGTNLTNSVQTTCELSGAGSVSNTILNGTGWSSAVGSSVGFGQSWYRCRISGVADGTGVLIPEIRIHNGSDSYPGATSQGVYLWGGQLEQAAEPSSYIPARNRFSNSEVMNAAPWVPSSSQATVDANFSTGPNGVGSADLLRDSGNTAAYIEQGLDVPNDGSNYTFSVYVQKNAPKVVAISLGFSGGFLAGFTRALAIDTVSGVANVANVAGGASAPANITVADADTYWRVSFSVANSNAGNDRLTVRLFPAFASALGGGSTNPANNLQDAALFWGAQLELSSVVSPYFRRDAVATHRDADHPYSSTGFTTWFNANEGSFTSSVLLGSVPVAPVTALSVTDGTVNSRMSQQWSGSGARFDIVAGGASQASPTRALTPMGAVRMASAYLYADSQLAVGGNLGAGAVTGTIPPVSRVNLGFTEVGSGYLNGHLRSFTYWNKRLPNALLQSVSQ